MGLPASEIQYEQAHITDNATNSIVAASVICFVVAGSAVSLRLISRRLRQLSLGVDDYLAIVAMLFVVGFLATTLHGLHVGLGKHIILSKNHVAYAKVAIAAQVTYAAGVVPIKFSLIFLYRRIFPNRSLHIALWFIGSVVACMGIAGILLAIFKCVPVKGGWDPTIQRQCINFYAWIIIHGLQNVITDFMLLCLPMPLVWRLNMATTRKIQVSGIFALGAFASVASIIRITYLGEKSHLDATWADVGAVTWSMVELCMGVTCACLPTLGPIFSYIRKGPSATHGVPKRPLIPRRMTPNAIDKKMTSSKQSWTDLRMRLLERSKGDGPFIQLQNSQEDVEGNWTGLAPVTNAHRANDGGLETNAVQSPSGSYEDRSFNAIKVTTDMQQDASKLNKI